MGQGRIAAKWNFIGDSFELISPKHPCFGVMGVWLDGIFVGSADLRSEDEQPSQKVFRLNGFPQGRHSVRTEPLEGRIAIDCLRIGGSPQVSIER